MIQINGYENYFVNSKGQIISTKRTKKGKEVKGTLYRGYVRVTLYKDGKGNRVYVHQEVAKALIPNPEGKKEVNHIDGNKENNDPSNLEWCDRSENIINTVIRGTNNVTSLTKEQVLDMREKWDSGYYDTKYLALLFDTSKGNIHKIVTRKTWKFI